MPLCSRPSAQSTQTHSCPPLWPRLCSSAPPFPGGGAVGRGGAEQESFEAALSPEGSGGDNAASHFPSLSQTRDNLGETECPELYQQRGHPPAPRVSHDPTSTDSRLKPEEPLGRATRDRQLISWARAGGEGTSLQHPPENDLQAKAPSPKPGSTIPPQGTPPTHPKTQLLPRVL